MKKPYKLWKPVLGLALALTLTRPVSGLSTAYAADAGPADGAETVQAGETSLISLDVVSGYGGAAKGGRYVPLEILLSSSRAESFSGYLNIKTMESDNEIYWYRYPVTVEGMSEVSLPYYVPLGSSSNQIFVCLEDSQEQELIQKRVRLDVSTDLPELFVGVLSDTPDQLLYFNGVGINYSMLRSKTFTMETADFPEDEIGLDMLDILVVSNYNLRDLSEIQTRAIMDWVRSGGILMLGTGQRVSETLGRFAPELLEDSYGTPELRQVDMGLEYADDSPGDSELELVCVDVPLQGGNVLFSDGELPVLTSVTREKGMIVVAAYDFCEIAQFCQNQPSYISEMLMKILGEEKIQELASVTYGNSQEYWSVQSMLNTGNVSRLPNIPLYALAVAVYLILVGPGLYLFLKRKNMQQHFGKGIVGLSLVFTGVIWLLGCRTRFSDTFFTYATIEDVTEDVITESSYLNMRHPYSRAHGVEVDGDYSVRPITRNSYYYDTQKSGVFTGREEADVRLDIQDDLTRIWVEDAPAFEMNLFHLEKRTENTQGVGIGGHINYFDGEVTGEITNRFDYPLEQVTILLYGKVIPVGRLEAGETRDLEGLEAFHIPLDDAYTEAQWISGNYRYETADIDNEEYLRSMEQANLLSFYMENYLPGYHTEARVVSFSTQQSETKFFVEDQPETYGTSLLTSTMELTYEKNGRQYRPVLMNAPTVISGGYQASANAMYGMNPLVLEYFLGSDLEIETLKFETLSPQFLADMKNYYGEEYDGNIYFYNYDTGNYDLMNMETGEFAMSRLRPYLSPGNTMTVKYTAGSAENYSWVRLPMLSVVGREK